MALKELHIKNFALIDELTVTFEKGFNALTGETGAGKSIIIDAVGSVLGERADAELIRTGKDSAVVEGLFDAPGSEIKERVKNAGIELEDDIIIKREIQKNGKSKCYINNTLVTLAVLKEIAEYLVDIHGQHEHQTLLHPDNQLELLDDFAGLRPLKAKFAEAYLKLNELKRRKDSLSMSEAEKERRIDMLSFQIKELEDAKLKEGEDEEIENLRNVLINSVKIAESINEINNMINGDENTAGGLGNIQEALKKLQNLSQIDVSLAGTAKDLEEAAIKLAETAGTVSNYRDKMDFNPARLEELEDRRDLILKLKKKYGQDIKTVLEYLEKLRTELKDITQNEEESAKLEKEFEAARKNASKLALELSAERKKAVPGFEKKVVKELYDVGMAKTRFKAEMSTAENALGLAELNGKTYELFPDGIDKTAFLISPNVGEDLKPLEKIASGGELSRIMLALKVILGEGGKVSTMIFDEIDTGIGGNMGKVIGEKMAKAAGSNQVICITHLPQIASLADHHLYVKKEVAGNRTVISVSILDEKTRVKEVARMLGDETKEITVKHARELLKR